MLRISKKKSRLNTKQEEIRQFHFRAYTKEILDRIIIIIKITKPKLIFKQINKKEKVHLHMDQSEHKGCRHKLSVP